MRLRDVVKRRSRYVPKSNRLLVAIKRSAAGLWPKRGRNKTIVVVRRDQSKESRQWQ